MTKAHCGDPGVLKLGSNDCDAAAEALEYVEVARRFTKGGRLAAPQAPGQR